MVFTVNIKCTKVTTLGVYLHAKNSKPIALPSAKMPNGQDKSLNPGNYSVALIAQYTAPGTVIDCEIKGANATSVKCSYSVDAQGKLLAFCSFNLSNAGDVT